MKKPDPLGKVFLLVSAVGFVLMLLHQIGWIEWKS